MVFIKTPSNAASFDCTKARSQIEKSICGNPELSRLDKNLAVSYRRLLEIFPIQGFIRAWQRDWLSSVRLTTCITDCSKELGVLYKKRLEQLSIENDALIFADTSEFSVEKPNTVVIIQHARQGGMMSVWVGFMIHRQFTIDAGKPVYIGCDFNGRINSPQLNSAIDGGTEINFNINQNKLEWSEEPKICAGFGRVPNELSRILFNPISSKPVLPGPIGEEKQQPRQKTISNLIFPINEQATFSTIKLGDIVWREKGLHYIRPIDLPIETDQVINSKLCKSTPLNSSRDKTLKSFECYLPIFEKRTAVTVTTLRKSDEEYIIGRIKLSLSNTSLENIIAFDNLIQSRYGDPLKVDQKITSKEDECKLVDQFSASRIACLTLARAAFPGKSNITTKSFRKNGIVAEAILSRAVYGNEINFILTTPEFDAIAKKIEVEEVKPTPEIISREKAF